MSVAQEIAKTVGVSSRLVSKVLLGGSSTVRVSAETRRRIEDAATRLNYRPNAAAKAISTGRFNAVALVMRAKTPFLPFQLQFAIHDTLAARDMHMMFARMPSEEIQQRASRTKVLREFCVDGLLVHDLSPVTAKQIDLIRRGGVPAVWLNTRQDCDCVYPDEHGGAAACTRRLIALGHRRIAFLGFYIDWSRSKLQGAEHFSVVDRRAGYRSAMSEAGLASNVVELSFLSLDGKHAPWGTEVDDRLLRCRELLSGPERPTAILAPSAIAAGPAVQAAAMLGLSIPRDLSIMAIHHDEVPYFGDMITTAEVPLGEVGRVGVEMLLGKIEDPSSSSAASVAVPFGEPKGNTVGPVN